MMNNMFEKKESHPSYGMLQFCRVNGGETVLFGSSIKHKDTIVMRLREGSVTRTLNTDWYNGDNYIAEVEMSQAQFAELITSMNCGTGVPVTIRYLQGKGEIEKAPFINKRTQFEEEFKKNLSLANEETNDLLQSVKEMFETKKSFTKKDKEEILSKIEQLNMTVGSNRDFIYKQFNKQMEKSTLEAKCEIEAFAQNKINSVASAALVEHKEELSELKCENPI